MAKYIPLDALVAEIERRRSKNAKNKLNLAAAFEDNYLLSFLDTLEVKEVDLKKEVNSYMVNEMKFLSDEIGYDTLSTIAKHFFELGMAVSNKA